MSKKISTTMLATLVATGALFLSACSAEPVMTPQERAKTFLENWISYEGNPIADEYYKKTDALTPNYVENINRVIASFDKGSFDPVLCAQDKPTAINVISANTRETDSLVTIEEVFSGGNRLIEVKLVQQEGMWLIDDIICQKGDQGAESPELSSPAIQQRVGDYIRENIGSLSSVEPVLGGSFYVTQIQFHGSNEAIVEYEDGHIAVTADVRFEVPSADSVTILSFVTRSDASAQINGDASESITEVR